METPPEQQNDIIAIVENTMEQIERALSQKGDESASTIVGREAGRYAQLMRQKYPNYSEVIAWHALIGSTPPSGNMPIPGLKPATIRDFPGDDSVLVFLKNLRQRLLHNE